ncbi:hypothetical protein EDB89DRAFT_1940791 [Lactarius sanguifluus]|nr:hypothetical protein EDB89DRAFT_1940791 [Lactarius sanguifluus]
MAEGEGTKTVNAIVISPDLTRRRTLRFNNVDSNEDSPLITYDITRITETWSQFTSRNWGKIGIDYALVLFGPVVQAVDPLPPVVQRSTDALYLMRALDSRNEKVPRCDGIPISAGQIRGTNGRRTYGINSPVSDAGYGSTASSLGPHFLMSSSCSCTSTAQRASSSASHARRERPGPKTSW